MLILSGNCVAFVQKYSKTDTSVANCIAYSDSKILRTSLLKYFHYSVLIIPQHDILRYWMKLRLILLSLVRLLRQSYNVGTRTLSEPMKRVYSLAVLYW